MLKAADFRNRAATRWQPSFSRSPTDTENGPKQVENTLNNELKQI